MPIEAEQRVGQSKIKLARDGAKFFLILLKIITIFSPLRIFVPISVITFALGFLYALRTICDAVARDQLVRAPHRAVGGDLPGRPGLRTDLGAQVRAPPVTWTGPAHLRRLTRTLAAALAAAFIVRVLFAFLYWVDKPLTHDELEYLSLARNLSEGHGFTYDMHEPASSQPERFGRAPLYPFFLSMVARVTSGATLVPAIKIAQAGLGAMTVLLVALVARRAGGDRAAAWAAWIGALYPPLAWMSSYMLSETLYTVLAFASVVALSRVIDGSARCQAARSASPWNARPARRHRWRTRRAHASSASLVSDAGWPVAALEARPVAGSGCGDWRGGGHWSVDASELPGLRPPRADSVGGRDHVLDRKPSAVAR